MVETDSLERGNCDVIEQVGGLAIVRPSHAKLDREVLSYLEVVAAVEEGVILAEIEQRRT